jgi:hypothetical protein
LDQDGQRISDVDPFRNIYFQLWQVPLPSGPTEYGDIVVAAVDIQDFDMGMTADALATAIATFSQRLNLSNFVINMSWVVVPCGEIPKSVDDYVKALCQVYQNRGEDLATSGVPAISELIADLSGVVSDICVDAIPDTVSELTRANLYNTPEFGRLWPTISHSQEQRATSSVMFQFMQCVGNPNLDNESCSQLFGQEVLRQGDDGFAVEKIIPVAAAGNTSLTAPIEYPFEPALWPTVLSVSAFDAEIYFANPGEVALKGTHLSRLDGEGNPIVGTSFAAPRMSIWAAIFLMTHGQAVCPSDSNQLPVLGYKTGDSSDFYTHEWVKDVADSFCPEFFGMMEQWPPDLTNASTSP